MPALRENNRASALRRTYLAYAFFHQRAAGSSLGRSSLEFSLIAGWGGGGGGNWRESGRVADRLLLANVIMRIPVRARARDMFSWLDIDPMIKRRE